MVKELTKAPVNISTSPIIIEKHTFTRGEKFFELSNHLGNVLAVVADKKLPVKATIDNSINFWLADVVTASGYYPFGMPMPGRNGIAFQSDWVPGRGFVAGNSYPDYLQVASRPYAPTPDAYRAGKEIELLPGFETATGTDELLVEIQAGSGVLSNDYPGGQSSNDMYGYYRYGFNGHEKSDEIKGSGNSYTAEFWEYDPRVGRRWNVDPIRKEYESPYATFSNNPIWLIDPTGSDTIRVDKQGYVDDIVTSKGNHIILNHENKGVVLNDPETDTELINRKGISVGSHLINYYDEKKTKDLVDGQGKILERILAGAFGEATPVGIVYYKQAMSEIKEKSYWTDPLE